MGPIPSRGVRFKSEAQLQREAYGLAEIEIGNEDKVTILGSDLSRWQKNTDSSTENWECPEDSEYCKSHHQLRRCKLEDKHGPEDEIPRVRLTISMHKKVRPEIKVFMEGQSSPVAFGRIVFENAEGARAFADSLVEHGVVGYVVHSDDE